MQELSNSLFLLLANLAQSRNRELMIRLFTEGIADIFSFESFHWCDSPPGEKQWVEVCTRDGTYGYYLYSPGLNMVHKGLLQNATQMLAVYLERLEQKTLLEYQEKELEIERKLHSAYADSTKKAREIEAMVMASKAIVDAEDYEKTARVIFDACSELIGSTSGYVALLAESGEENEVLFLEAGGLPCDVDPSLPMPIRGLRADSYHSGKVVWDNDFMNSEHVEYMPDGHCVLHNVMFSPLVIAGKVEGIMGLANKEDGFTEEDARIATTFGEFAALGLRNSRQEELLRKSEERYRSIFEASNVGIGITTFEGQVVMVNDELCNILGYPRKELISMDISSLYPYSEDRKKLLASLQKTGKADNHLIRINRKDGRLVWIRISSTVIRYAEQDNALISVFMDVTLQQAKDAMLTEKNQEIARQNEEYAAINEELTSKMEEIQHINDKLENARRKAEESDLLKSAFLANMSHEIRTPMNAIIGFSGLLGDKDIADEKKGRFVDLIKNSGKQLLKIINDIIDISKIESNQLTIDLAPCNVYDSVKEVVDIYERMPALKNKPDLDLRFIPPSLPMQFTLITDAVRLKQIIGNILSNAIKHTSEGEVTITYGKDNKQQEEVILFRVSDTGSGIPEENQKIIFERFVQGRSDQPLEGTGLGLSIVQGILLLLGGEIWLESREGKGTTVFFTLPCREVGTQSRSDAAGPGQSEIPDYSDRLVFIAEDDPASGIYLKELLHDTQVRIRQVKNGLELMDLLKEQRPDLIFLDINMPVMNGYEVIEKIRKSYPGLPVIAQTAYAMPDERERILQAGCNGYIAKPLEKEQVLYEMARYLGG